MHRVSLAAMAFVAVSCLAAPAALAQDNGNSHQYRCELRSKKGEIHACRVHGRLCLSEVGCPKEGSVHVHCRGLQPLNDNDVEVSVDGALLLTGEDRDTDISLELEAWNADGGRFDARLVLDGATDATLFGICRVRATPPAP